MQWISNDEIKKSDYEYIPYSGYFSRGNIFVVFVVERRTTKYLHTKKRKPRRVPRARAQNHEIVSTK